MLWHKAFSDLIYPNLKSDHLTTITVNVPLLTDSLIILSRTSSVGIDVSRGVTIAHVSSKLSSRSFLASVVSLPKRNAIRTASTARGSSSVKDLASEIAVAEI